MNFEAERANISMQLTIALEHCQFSMMDVLKKHKVINGLDAKLNLVYHKFNEYKRVYNLVQNTSKKFPKLFNQANKLLVNVSIFMSKMREQTKILREFTKSLRLYGELQIKNMRLARVAENLQDLKAIKIPGFCFVPDESVDSLLTEWDNLRMDTQVEELLKELKTLL